jgi:hypothetical protein
MASKAVSKVVKAAGAKIKRARANNFFDLVFQFQDLCVGKRVTRTIWYPFYPNSYWTITRVQPTVNVCSLKKQQSKANHFETNSNRESMSGS